MESRMGGIVSSLKTVELLNLYQRKMNNGAFETQMELCGPSGNFSNSNLLEADAWNKLNDSGEQVLEQKRQSFGNGFTNYLNVLKVLGGTADWELDPGGTPKNDPPPIQIQLG